MVLLSEVKALLNYSPAASGDDALIQENINIGLAYIAAVTTLSVASSGSDFEEYFDYNSDEFSLSVKSNDIDIVSITAYAEDGSSSSVDVSTLKRHGPRTWEFYTPIFNVESFKVVYNAASTMKALNRLIAEIAVWEFLKMPNKSGALTKTSAVANELNISYRTEKEFYDNIDRQIARLVVTW